MESDRLAEYETKSLMAAPRGKLEMGWNFWAF